MSTAAPAQAPAPLDRPRAESSPTALAAAVRHTRTTLARAGVAPKLGLAALLRWVLERQLAAAHLCGERELSLLAPLSAEHAALRAPAALDVPELAACWHDASSLGWAYQFWNDLDREAIDRRIGPRGRVRLDELASKTQLFTERYMVDWLVQNSIGRLLRHLPSDAPYLVGNAAPARGAVRPLEELRVLDPACGTGHFLLGAFDFLFEAHRAQARADGVRFDAADTARLLVGRTLHGLDLDPTAVRITAAALWLKVQGVAPGAVLPPLQLAALSFDAEAGAPPEVQHALAEMRWRGTLTRCETLPEVVRQYLAERTPESDLGVRAEPAAAPVGARALAMLRERAYDVVLSNPPYLATAKIDLEAERVAEAFDGMPDLFAAFTRRSLELCREDGTIAFVAPSNWMFLHSFRSVRELLLRGHVALLADLGKGAFRHASKLIQTAMVVAQPGRCDLGSLGARLGSRDDIAADQAEQLAASLREPDRFQWFDTASFGNVEGAPFLFWIEPSFLQRYASLPKIEDVARGAGGIATGNNERFVRAIWEVPPATAKAAVRGRSPTHLPYLKGAEGRAWIEPCRSLLRGVEELKLARPGMRIEPATELGVAYTTIGQRFGARLHTARSVRDVSGASFFPTGCSAAELLCALNKRPVRELACALNPTINFQLGDVRRLPFDREPHAEQIAQVLQTEFDRAERGNELSPSFQDARCRSAWEAARRWAQQQVDRPFGAALVPFAADAPEPDPDALVSQAVGVAFGRFGAAGEGWLEHPPAGTVSFFVADDDGIALPCFASLHAAWAGAPASYRRHATLATYLRRDFFASHRRRYQNRPIYLPLSSRRRSFVAWIALHRFYDGMLEELCDLHLAPRLASAGALRAELQELIGRVRAVGSEGPPPAAPGGSPRERNARFAVDLDDGVLVHTAALWPLLEPQWKDPRRLWGELSDPTGKRDYDWSKLAARYFPSRVHAKCTKNPSLALAHGRSEPARSRTALAPARHPRILEP